MSNPPASDQSSCDRRDDGRRSVFPRHESGLAHSVYGLILALATVGELIHADLSWRASVGWLIGAGAVLLSAHLFSDVLAHLALTGGDPEWSQILRVGRADLSVTFGFVGASMILVLGWLAQAEMSSALTACLVVGLVSVGLLSLSATSHHRAVTRLVMSAGAVALSAAIVVAENTL